MSELLATVKYIGTETKKLFAEIDKLTKNEEIERQIELERGSITSNFGTVVKQIGQLNTFREYQEERANCIVELIGGTIHLVHSITNILDTVDRARIP